MSTLIRGYPPVLGAMLLVDGVLTLILGGDATVSLGEVVAYLLLPPLAMFLLTRLTGGGLNPVAIGVGVAGAVVVFAALFLGGGVHLLTLPGWVLVVVGLLLLGVAVVLMRRSAPTQGPVPAEPERDGHDDDFGAASRDLGAAPPRDDFGDFGRSPDDGWPSSSRYDDDPAPSGYPAARPADETAGLPRVPPGHTAPGHAAGPSEPEWPPRRDPADAPAWPDPAQAWPDPGPAQAAWPDPAPVQRAWSDPEPVQPAWSDPEPVQPAWSDPEPVQPAWSDPEPAQPARSDGPKDREWPPAPSAHEWPPRRDPEPAPDAQRSWFEPEDPEPADASWTPDSDREWPPTSGGRRSHHPDR